MLASDMTQKLVGLSVVLAIVFALAIPTIGAKKQDHKTEDASTSSLNPSDLSYTTRKVVKLEAKGHADANFTATTLRPSSTNPIGTQNYRSAVFNSSIVATTTSKRPGLITRTSDAIYKALTGYFSHDDDEALDDERNEFGAKLTTTTTSVRSSPAEERITTSRPTDRSSSSVPSSTRPTLPTRAHFTISTTQSSTVPTGSASDSHTTRTKSGAVTSAKPHLETTAGHSSHPAQHEILPVKPSHKSTTSQAHTQSPTRTTHEAHEAERSSTRRISTTTESSSSKLTTAPHLKLEFSDHDHKTHPSTGQTFHIQTTTKLPSRSSTTHRATDPTSSHHHIEKTTLATTSKTGSSETKPPATTTKPTETTSTTIPSYTPLALKANESAHEDLPQISLHENSTSSLLASFHLFSLLNRAFLSIKSELMLLNRTTRLAREQIHDGLDESTTMQIEHETEIEDGVDSNRREFKFRDRLSNLTSTLDGAPSGRAITDGQQVMTSREDIMLLCKLLHKHLEGGPNNTNNFALNLKDLTDNMGQTRAQASKPELNSSATTTSTAVPVRVDGIDLDAGGDASDRKWLIDEPRSELSEHLHGSRLLESVFALEPATRAADSEPNRFELNQNGSVYEEAGIRLLTDLFNLGFRRRLTATRSGVEELESGGDLSRGVSLKVWSKTLTEGRSGRLRLVYWLLEPSNVAPSRVPMRRFKVLDLSEAQDLIDRLDHALVQRVINDVGLVRPRGILVAAHRSHQSDSGDQTLSPPPRVVDDQLVSPHGGGQNEGKTSTLQLFVNRLTSSSFNENLHLYLILAVVILFIIVMCFAVPALCCKCMVSSSRPDRPFDPMDSNRRAGRRMRAAANPHGASSRGRRQQPQSARGFYRSMDPLRESITSISQSLAANGGNEGNGNSKPLEAPAIWRKLSNSTTTMTKDEIRTLEDDGQFELVCGVEDGELRAGSRGGRMSPSKTKFEWYTFEDNKEQTLTRRQNAEPSSCANLAKGQRGNLISKPTQTTMLLRDQTKLTKSVQTYALGDEAKSRFMPDSGSGTPLGDEHLSLAYHDRLETRNSNTLTKSELVMLKEKLIPIGRQRSKQDEGQQIPPAPRISHDYVNTAANDRQHVERAQIQGPSRHIDSSSIDSLNGTRNLSSTVEDAERSRRRAAELGERTPTMRFLELPKQTQGKVDAIKQELTKVEERDLANLSSRSHRAASGNQPYSDTVGTYKRYDVI